MSTSNNTVCIILARGGSKRIPRKNLMALNGLPLVVWSIQQALNSSSIDQVFVSTDDDEIASVSKNYGAEIIKRPIELAGDKSTSESALLHALYYIENFRKITTIVFLQPTSPVRSDNDINDAVTLYFEKEADSLFSACMVEGFIWKKTLFDLTPVNYDPSTRKMNQDLSELSYEENGSIYVFSPETLRKHNSRIGVNCVLYGMPRWRSYQLDRDEDTEILSFFLEKIRREKNYKSLPEKIDLVVYDFDGVMTDNKVVVDEHGTEGVVCNRSDGLGVNLIKDLGIKQMIISTETNKVVIIRGEKLGINVLGSCSNKKQTLFGACSAGGFDLQNVVYIGNDVNDLEVMKIVGCSVAPSDSHIEIKNVANIILNSKGGEGVVREFAELLNEQKSV